MGGKHKNCKTIYISEESNATLSNFNMCSTMDMEQISCAFLLKWLTATDKNCPQNLKKNLQASHLNCYIYCKYFTFRIHKNMVLQVNIQPQVAKITWKFGGSKSLSASVQPVHSNFCLLWPSQPCCLAVPWILMSNRQNRFACY